ncbi:MAG: hypothetical protein NZ804_01350, partial [Roseibacillus sp.]|nr:hypothetical protein [Roseibacillus sp.]
MLKKLLGLDTSQEVDQVELAFRGGLLLGLFLVAAAIAFAFFLYRREELVPRNRRIAMMILQAAALLTLIVVIMQPFAKIRMTKESKRSMIVMLDTSRSMAIEDPRTSAEDVEEAAKALGEISLDRPPLGTDDAQDVKQKLG